MLNAGEKLWNGAIVCGHLTRAHYSAKSYAGKYEIFYLANGWKTLFCNGKAIGSAKVKGGVYALANHFDK